MTRGPSRKVSNSDILDLFDPGVPETSVSLSEKLPYHPDTVYNRLSELAHEGKVENKKPGSRSCVWWIDDPRNTIEPTSIVKDNYSRNLDAIILIELAKASKKSEPLTVGEVANRTGKSSHLCYRRLQKLDECNLIDSLKAGSTSKVWWIIGQPDPDMIEN